MLTEAARDATHLGQQQQQQQQQAPRGFERCFGTNSLLMAKCEQEHRSTNPSNARRRLDEGVRCPVMTAVHVYKRFCGTRLLLLLGEGGRDSRYIPKRQLHTSMVILNSFSEHTRVSEKHHPTKHINAVKHLPTNTEALHERVWECCRARRRVY